MIFTREDILKIQNALLQLGRKDSEFKDANTPLNNNDEIAILQDGINKKVSINNLLSTLGLLKKDDFINVSDRYDEYYIQLSEAITIIANNKRKKGLVITFQNLQGDWKIFQFDGELNNFSNTDYWKDLFDFKYPIVNSVLPDEEDLTLTLPNKDNNSFIKLKDKEYDTTNFSGMGTKIIRKNIIKVTQEDGTIKRINYLSQDVFNSENTIYIIKYDFTLNEDITIPKNCILDFDGGSIKDGTINLNNVTIVGTPKFSNINCSGIIKNDIIYSVWFSNIYLNNIASLFSKGKTILIEGTYYVDDSIVLDSNVCIKGTGTVSKIVFNGNSNKDIFKLPGKTSPAYDSLLEKDDYEYENIEISGITFDYNRTNVSTDISIGWISLYDCKNINIHDNNFISTGEVLEYPKSIHFIGCKNVKVENCYSEKAPLVYFIKSEGGYFNNNIGVDIYSTFIEHTQSFNGTISHNFVIGTTGTGKSVLSSNSVGVLFDNNYIDANQDELFLINLGHTSSTSSEHRELLAKDNIVKNNTLKGGSISIYSQQSENLIIKNNKIDSNKKCIVFNSSAINNIIENNIIKCSYKGTSDEPETSAIIRSKCSGDLIFKNNKITFVYGYRAIFLYSYNNLYIENNMFVAEYNENIIAGISLFGKKTINICNNSFENIVISHSGYNYIVTGNKYIGYNTQNTYANASATVGSFRFEGNDLSEVTNQVSRFIWFYSETYSDNFLNNIIVKNNKFGNNVTPLITFRNINLDVYLDILEINRGVTAQRPKKFYTGYKYFDTTLGKPIYWNGTAWVDATGTTV